MNTYQRYKNRILGSRKRMLKFGSERSTLNRARPVRMRDINFVWKITLAYPFSFALSKNSAIRSTGGGRFYKRDDVRKAQSDMVLIIRNSIKKLGVKPAKSKVWVKIHVEKPSMKGDAINVIDTICDAIKYAIDVDDNWFCIERLDWSIVKKDPHVLIEIGQEYFSDQWPCQSCGFVSTKINSKSDPYCSKCKKHRKVNRVEQIE